MAEAVYKRIVLSASRDLEAGLQARGINRNLVLVALMVALVFIAASLFYVWAQQQVISLGYEISQANQEEQELSKINKKLRLDLASLKSPGRIESLAIKDMGFVNPKKEQLIIVR